MGLSYYFAEAADKASEVLEWFRSVADPAEETATDLGVVLFFRHLGPLVPDEHGNPDGTQSPLISLALSRERRSMLWTTGAVHFLPSPLSRFPQIAKLHREFKAWVTTHPLVHDPRRGASNPYDYYLLGAAANRGELYGLPSAIEALERGQYYVDPLDNDVVLDTACRTLRLRGIECGRR